MRSTVLKVVNLLDYRLTAPDRMEEVMKGICANLIKREANVMIFFIFIFAAMFILNIEMIVISIFRLNFYLLHK